MKSHFRLHVFYEVVQRQSFTKASEVLGISQPAVTKHVRALEEEYQLPLLERKGVIIHLTQAGEILKIYCEKIFSLERQLTFEMDALKDHQGGTIRIGASTTIAQYIIPSVIAEFQQKVKDAKVEIKSGNTEAIENWLIEDKIDIGMIEGSPHRGGLKYIPFLNDELVLVASSKFNKLQTVELQDIFSKPIVMREQGSGTRKIIEHALKGESLSINDLNIIMELDTTESIKRYIASSPNYAILSIYSVLDELNRDQLQIIDIENFEMNRKLHFVIKEGGSIGLGNKFMDYTMLHYNKK
ncbi:LysR substrate-binding domain-containing protein [Flammeovirga kamogawensis]|uniref:LysR family transcriptional regulator n=1 Tax=Flammeovirga kamogawensis TaxID=373891 RepID=A0ABX8GUI3_9BACT|nr:LysR substrate-binding domain-containing protein [Flammeovirga kamogawensis]MBB6460005.1 DNA-binding transcriptional LysR family regulator [Flammeovirga kamogawensis]QWG06947.1 LysR family transcriptional regulator [Flammeovirga kamogawensis]TRX68767.1 LysR family transcriptional regulator [Flammeovirga kamogawensis]